MSSMSLAVSAGAVRPPPNLLMPLLLDSSPPSLTLVSTCSPRTASTVSTIRPSLRSSGSPDAGPRVATIFVARRAMGSPSGAILADRCGRGGVSAVRALLEDLERRQLLAFEHLEERAAAGRDVADVLLDAVLRDRRERVAAARDAEGRGLRDGARDRLRAVRERVELEDAHRPVPHDRARRRQLL